MPTVSESLAKLSQRAKEAEEHTAAARNETREQLEARVAEARATAQRRREEMKARSAKMHGDLASAWASLQAHVQEQFEKIRAKLEEKRDDLDAKAAERRAERAEANAADAIDFASWAVDEAEAAALEATDARKIADALRRACHRRQVRSKPRRDLVEIALKRVMRIVRPDGMPCRDEEDFLPGGSGRSWPLRARRKLSRSPGGSARRCIKP